ncbi:MAG: hypothetical protein J7L47_06805 [Candidatus Odinarchaeota archaeon]|nr:hypothetical protein [Candidatus Odinarchaeota archaeon]
MNDSILKEILNEEDKNKLKIVRNLLEDIIENIDLLLDEEVMKKIQEAEEDIRQGRVKNWVDFEKELGLDKAKKQ